MILTDIMVDVLHLLDEVQGGIPLCVGALHSRLQAGYSSLQNTMLAGVVPVASLGYVR
jgi:hypothetical protein